jgi:hypothetical protein
MGNIVMKWAIEVRKTSLGKRNLADLLKGIGFDLIQENECLMLSSRTIEDCATAADVFEIAKGVRAAFNGSVKIDPEFSLGSVIDYDAAPPRRHVFLEGVSCVVKSTCGTAAITISPPEGLSSEELTIWHEECDERQYQAALGRQRAILEPAFFDPKAAKAIELLCIDNPSGETLYKIYELAEGHPSNRAAFHAEFNIVKEQFERFKDAVHNPAVTGDWARHAYHQKPNTTNPMTRVEAEQFVRRVADNWLRSIQRSK